MKKSMMALTFVSAIASIDMIHASASAAAAAGAGAGAQAKVTVIGRMPAADFAEFMSAQTMRKSSNEATTGPKESTVARAMKFVQYHYDFVPLSLEGLEDMISYTDNRIKVLSARFLEKTYNQPELSLHKITDVPNYNLSILHKKLMKHSKDFFKQIYEQASEDIYRAHATVEKECRELKEMEFNTRLRFFLEEKAGMVALAKAINAHVTQASTAKPAGGPALPAQEEDTQEA